MREAAKSAKAAAKAKAKAKAVAKVSGAADRDIDDDLYEIEWMESQLLKDVTPTHESVALEMKWIEYRVLIMEWARLNNNLTRDAKELCPEAKGDSSLRSVPVEVLRVICSFYCYE